MDELREMFDQFETSQAKKTHNVPIFGGLKETKDLYLTVHSDKIVTGIQQEIDRVKKQLKAHQEVKAAKIEQMMSLLFQDFALAPALNPVDRKKQLATRRMLPLFGFVAGTAPDFEWPKVEDLAGMKDDGVSVQVSAIDFYQSSASINDSTIAAIQVELSNGQVSPLIKNPNAVIGEKKRVCLDF